MKRVIEEVTVPAGTLLVREGEPGLLFFIVREGRATVARSRQVIASLGPGDFFGELALLDNQPRFATVTSDTEMTLLIIRRRHFQRVLDATPTLARKLLRSTADRLRAVDKLADR